MTSFGLALQFGYFGVLSLLALYGLHRLSLVWIFLRESRRTRAGRSTQPDEATPGGSWPAVTVQLPIYNEYYVLERLLRAACGLRYPDGLLEIQVLDDSDDRTRHLAARLVASYRALGHDIHHIRRKGRDGYKAGALAGGMARARGELIAVFDADFIPPAEFLERTVPRFADGRVGMVQARWGHTNRDYSLLTRAQALLLDGHFVVEHGARHAAGRFFNFNGTAGIFRRACIEEAGGWQGDTLTEDLDLSYRAQLAGWRFELMPDLVVPAELPVELNSLRSQQRRWAMGSIQTARKLLPAVLTAPLPRPVKLEAIVHLTNNLAYPLLALLAILIVPALTARADRPWTYLMLDLPLLLAGTGSFALFCGVAQHGIGEDWRMGMLRLPALMAIGIGLCLNNGLAVLRALVSHEVEFHRTPKFCIGAREPDGPRAWSRLAYRGPRSTLILLEVAFALYFAAAVALGLLQARYASLPFLLLFEVGFLYVSGIAIAQAVSRRITPRPETSREAPERWRPPPAGPPPRG